jgi:hypothetical protein
MKQVAEYQGKPDLDMFAHMLADAGRSYGNCMVVVENNNIGYSVLTKLIEMEYPNVYHSVKSTHEYIEQYEAEYRVGTIPGFTTSMKTRPLIIAKLEEFIRNDLITIMSSRFAAELKTFIWNNGKPEAMKGYNDDLTMSMAIACWVRDTALIGNQRDLEYRKALIGGISVSGTKLKTTIPGQHGHYGHDVREDYADKKKELDPFMWLSKG